MEGVCIQLIKASHREFQRLKVILSSVRTADNTSKIFLYKTFTCAHCGHS
jgi:hypothetical protein